MLKDRAKYTAHKQVMGNLQVPRVAAKIPNRHLEYFDPESWVHDLQIFSSNSGSRDDRRGMRVWDQHVLSP